MDAQPEAEGGPLSRRVSLWGRWERIAPHRSSRHRRRCCSGPSSPANGAMPACRDGSAPPAAVARGDRRRGPDGVRALRRVRGRDLRSGLGLRLDSHHRPSPAYPRGRPSSPRNPRRPDGGRSRLQALGRPRSRRRADRARGRPSTYIAAHWRILWIGLDLMMAALALVTLIAVRRRSAFAALSAAMLAGLLLSDDWFDCLTANSSDLPESLVSLGAEVAGAMFFLWIALGAVRRAQLAGERAST